MLKNKYELLLTAADDVHVDDVDADDADDVGCFISNQANKT